MKYIQVKELQSLLVPLNDILEKKTLGKVKRAMVTQGR